MLSILKITGSFFAGLFIKNYLIFQITKRSFKYSRAANEQKSPPSQQQQQQKQEQPKTAQHHGHSHEESHHGHSHQDHGHGHKKEDKTKKVAPPQSKSSIALYATLSTLLISIAPFFILFFIPLNNNSFENQSLLKVLLAFASGSLLGDAFLHLIPHALNPHDHSSEHSHSHETDHPHDHSAQTSVGLWILAGIMAFLLVEKVVRNLNGESHTHSHGTPAPAPSKAVEETTAASESKTKRKDATKVTDDVKTDHSEEKEAKEKKSEEKHKKGI